MPDIVPELSEEDLKLLEFIFQQFWKSGVWPTFRDIDRPFAREKIDSQEILAKLTPSLIHRTGFGNYVDSNEVLRLTLLGITKTSGSSTVIPLFLQVLKYLTEFELNFDSTSEMREPVVAESDIINLFSLNGRPIEIATFFARNIGPIIREERNIFNSIWWKSDNSEWAIELSRNIRRFKDTDSIETYLQLSNEFATSASGHIDLSGTALATLTESYLTPSRDSKKVFVVHGRDAEAKSAIIEFLRKLGLDPFDWTEPVRGTGAGTPYTGDIVSQAFEIAQAVVVLITPDEIAELHSDFHQKRDSEIERGPSSQVRPNVLFEAGMAFVTHPKNTILVEIGITRGLSDLSGRNTIRIEDGPNSLVALAMRLEDASCPVEYNDTEWKNWDQFKKLQALTRSSEGHKRANIFTRIKGAIRG